MSMLAVGQECWGSIKRSYRIWERRHRPLPWVTRECGEGMIMVYFSPKDPKLDFFSGI